MPEKNLISQKPSQANPVLGNPNMPKKNLISVFYFLLFIYFYDRRIYAERKIEMEKKLKHNTADIKSTRNRQSNMNAEQQSTPTLKITLKSQKNLISKKSHPTASSNPIEVPPATMSAEMSPATIQPEDATKKFDKEKVMPPASTKPEVPPATMSTTKKPCGATLAIVNQIMESREDAMKAEMADMEKRIEEIAHKKMEEMFAKMLGDRLAEPAPKPKKSAKGGESADAEAPAEKGEGYYEVGSPLEEIRRLRTINKELRKESEGKTKTNQKLQERIADLESDDAITKYAQEIERLKGINQEMRKRCVGKDNTNQKLKAELDALKKKYCPEPEDE